MDGLDTPRSLTVTFGAEEAPDVLTITGTDMDGRPVVQVASVRPGTVTISSARFQSIGPDWPVWPEGLSDLDRGSLDTQRRRALAPLGSALLPRPPITAAELRTRLDALLAAPSLPLL